MYWSVIAPDKFNVDMSHAATTDYEYNLYYNAGWKAIIPNPVYPPEYGIPRGLKWPIF